MENSVKVLVSGMSGYKVKEVSKKEYNLYQELYSISKAFNAALDNILNYNGKIEDMESITKVQNKIIKKIFSELNTNKHQHRENMTMVKLSKKDYGKSAKNLAKKYFKY
jgi:hypothetical protein